MGLGPIHCGSFLLLAACVLLLVATISAPVVHDISFLNVHNGGSETTFGVFGYCQNANVGHGTCSGSKLGYDIASISGEVSSHTYINSHLQTLTKALILHPIACGIAFIAFIIALLSHHIGFILASLISFLAFIVSLAALVVDFVLFTIIKHEINHNTSATASYATAIWLTLAATIVLFFAGFVVCFECFGHRSRSRNATGAGTAGAGYGGYDNGYVGNQPMEQVGYAPRREHWWNRSSNKY